MNLDAPHKSEAPRLDRVLGPWMGTALVIGTIIGSGVFKKPQAVADQVPEFGLGMLAWVLVGLFTLIGSLTVAEVAVLYPRAGGNYVYLREAYGRLAGFLWGWVDFWIIRSGSIAALASVFTESLHDVLRELHADGQGDVLSFWALQGTTVAVIALLALVNVRGTTWGGALQVVVTAVKVLSLAGIALLPLLVLPFITDPERAPSVARLAPVWPAAWDGFEVSKFGAALVAVFWAYHGWMNITPVAEEVREPGRNIPLSLIAGTLAVVALYLSVNVAYYLVVPRDDIIAARTTPVAAVFAARLFPSVGVMLASAAVMTSVFGSLNGNLLVGPRLLYAMGQDGLAPRAMGRLHARFHTPALAEAALAGWSILLVVGVAVLVQYRLLSWEVGGYSLDLNLRADASQFNVLTDYAMFGAISFETLGVASIFVFRRRFPPARVPLPYRCRLYPWLPAIYVLFMAAVLANMFVTNRTESLAAVGFIGLGAVVYALVFTSRPADKPAA
jgi:amino acid transporter